MVPAPDRWQLALTVLAGDHRQAAAEFVTTAAALRGAGARLFEVIVGTPSPEYGGRVTFLTGEAEPDTVVRLAGLSGHPWGRPDWIGLRTDADGSVRAKAYHRRPPLDTALVHRGMPEVVRPVMAARSGQTIEVYAMVPGQSTWERFAPAALAPLGCAPEPPGVTIVPRTSGFAVSVRHDAGVLSEITLFATAHALRPDAELAQEWVAGLGPEAVEQHRRQVIAAATLGRVRGRRYRMLAWRYTGEGLVGRAVSIHAVDGAP